MGAAYTETFTWKCMVGWLAGPFPSMLGLKYYVHFSANLWWVGALHVVVVTHLINKTIVFYFLTSLRRDTFQFHQSQLVVLFHNSDLLINNMNYEITL